jgi:hypothetical protein
MVKRSVLEKALQELDFNESDVDELMVQLASSASPVVSQARARIKTAYRQSALKWHPDKSKQRRDSNAAGGGGIAEERFKRISAAYELLTDENRTFIDDDYEEEDFDYEEYCNSFQPRSEMYEIFKAALLGKDVETELRNKGCHRPPANFGVSPFPPFDLKQQLNLGGKENKSNSNSNGFDGVMQTLKGTRDDDGHCTQSFLHHLKAHLLAERAKLEHVGAYGVAVYSVVGDFKVVKRWRRGVERVYPNFELSIRLSCTLDIDLPTTALSKNGVPAHIVVPYFGDECEEDEIRVEVQMQRKRDEVRCKRAVHDRIRAGLKKTIAPMLLQCIQEAIPKNQS